MYYIIIRTADRIAWFLLPKGFVYLVTPHVEQECRILFPTTNQNMKQIEDLVDLQTHLQGWILAMCKFSGCAIWLQWLSKATRGCFHSSAGRIHEDGTTRHTCDFVIHFVQEFMMVKFKSVIVDTKKHPVDELMVQASSVMNCVDTYKTQQL